MKKNPSPSTIMPVPIFMGVVSFFPNLETQSIPKSGANVTMNNGFTDWNQGVGISNPKTVRSIYLSVYKLNEEPACSKPAQKKIAKTNMTKITMILSFSSLVKGFLLLTANSSAVIPFTTEPPGFEPISPRYLFPSVLNSI